MKTKHLATLLIVLAALLAIPAVRAADITAAGSGNWTSTNLDAPWPLFGTNSVVVVPGTNDDVDVELPNDVTVDSVAYIQYIYGGGTITMSPGSTLHVVGDIAGAEGTQSLSNLDTSAAGNSVIYSGNAFWAKHQSYYNLTLNGGGTFYNGNIGEDGDNDNGPLTISGNLILGGSANVQQADSITILGNLVIGTNSGYDASVAPVTVVGNTTISGILIDGSGNTTNLDDSFNNITITPGGSWRLTDVIEWAVSGSLTNNGSITYVKGPGGGGAITFTGTGVITGNPFTLWNIFLEGNNTISTTITATNFIGLGGTVVFDLANPQKLVLSATSTNALTYGGNLTVINSGPAPASGTSYQLFSAASYGGSFATTNLPALPAGLSWVDNLATSGSISVTGTAIGNAPVLTVSLNGTTLKLSWDSTDFPGYSVQAQTNSTTVGNTWFNTPSGTTSPYTLQVVPGNTAVYFRLMHP
jgi:hypothetical protein